MPTITITDDQAEALAAGRDITIASDAETRTYILTYASGNVFVVKTAQELPTGYWEDDGPTISSERAYDQGECVQTHTLFWYEHMLPRTVSWDIWGEARSCVKL